MGVTLIYDEVVNLDDYLDKVQLLDCEGRVTATLILQPNGTVAVERTNSVRVIVEPSTRTVLTPGVRLDAGLVDAACALARS